SVYNQALYHSITFNKFKNKEVAKNIKFSLLEKGLSHFEAVQLLNLCPDSIDETKSLIPSISQKKTDDQIQRILNEIDNSRRLQ
ncbi:hypothetical protein ROZALSC1DRAFT_29117, partial [Rozella allomycis CSF55]